MFDFFIVLCSRNQYQSTWQLGVSDHGQACRLQFYFNGWQHPTDEMALSERPGHDDYQGRWLYLGCWWDYFILLYDYISRMDLDRYHETYKSSCPHAHMSGNELTCCGHILVNIPSLEPHKNIGFNSTYTL